MQDQTHAKDVRAAVEYNTNNKMGGLSALPPLLQLAALLSLVLLSATAASGMSQQQAQRMTWDEFLSSQQTWHSASFPVKQEGQKPQPPVPTPPGPKPPLPKPSPPPGKPWPGPNPPPGPLLACSGLPTDPCVIPAGVQVRGSMRDGRQGVQCAQGGCQGDTRAALLVS